MVMLRVFRGGHSERRIKNPTQNNLGGMIL